VDCGPAVSRRIASAACNLQKAGFGTKVVDTRDLNAVKQQLSVPDDLAACHTAQLSCTRASGM
jgi:hypothetical protein